MSITALDWVLAAALVTLAAVVLHVRDRFTSIVLFIVFGLLMATIWARLGAVDVALAEAAIGAGITGALLFNALGDMAVRGGPEQAFGAAEHRIGRTLIGAALVIPIAWLLVGALLSTPAELDVLGPEVAERLDSIGVEHDVTAVLLGVRAYDTLLELAVLLVAAIGVRAVHLPLAERESATTGPLLSAAERALVPIATLIGGYLLWRGSEGPGGAFAAGAVIAGAAILAQLGSGSAARLLASRVADLGLGAGLLVFGAAGLTATAFGRPLLFVRGSWAAMLIPVIELAATIAIALALLGIFIGRPPPQEDR